MVSARKFLLLLFLCTIAAKGQEFHQDTLPKFSASTVAELAAQFDDIFEDPSFASASIGVMVQSVANGEYLYKLDENKLMVPASNLKLLTTAAGLYWLGKDYQFKTEIYARGKQDGLALKGDLIIKGFGDPTISGRFYSNNMLRLFESWADTLLEHGIDEIAGNIIGDDNAFDDIGLGEGWQWDYESDWYAAPSGALSFNDNCVDFLVTPTSVGEKAKLDVQPLTKYITVIYNVVTVSTDSVTEINVYRERKTNVISITGTIKEKNEPVKCYATINNPTQYFVNVFRDVLIRKGILVKGFGVDIDDMTESLDYKSCQLLFTHRSATLPVILNIINKNSQNFFAEQLLKTIGYEKDRIGSAANGLRWVKKFLANSGINLDNIILVDGSGLSRLNLVSPKQLVTVLNYMAKQDNFKYYYNSLSIAGKDGSLANRMLKSRAENNLHGKTGFVGAARSLSGYVTTGDNELLSFSILVNNYTVPVKLVDNLQDLICIRLANFKRK
ncbi:MAG: D-alanyl-D-alanine carboxypeptidase/D-alanyl-D-alanine-endopeptidase [Ignavibacteria bacterium]|nr:D-alanyl-D-alanine carboxypeptidase/D-alanyl-D-alanine-endopeptidase [Ignavibacteria bacterium]